MADERTPEQRQADIAEAERKAADLRAQADAEVAAARRGEAPLTDPAGTPVDQESTRDEFLRVDVPATGSKKPKSE